MIDRIRRCYHAAHHSALATEKPLHMAYFVIVAFEAHGAYGVVAGLCAVVMCLTFGGEA